MDDIMSLYMERKLIKKILISALEPSANLHLEPILPHLNRDIVGIFDNRFGSPLYDTREFSVMGFWDVLPKIKMAKRAIKEMVELAKECDRVLLIDAPSFNLPLAKALKKRYPNLEITYYILPKVWAWKKKRVKKVEKYCDNLASIFPFEPNFYNRATYIGNPLLDEIKLRKDPNLDYNTIAFMPGSRKGEVARLMPIFKEVAKEIKGRKVIIVPPFLKGEDLKETYGDLDDFDISYIMQETLAYSDFAFICSGTATLEAAIIGVPFVLAYKTKSFDFKIARFFIKLKYAGLANLILDFAGKKPLHHEFLQDEVTKENLLKEYREFDKYKFARGSYDLIELLKEGSSKNLINLLK
jgi:lipid-A-disaccharide synthase